MFVRLNGHFDSHTQPALRQAFDWIATPVTIDVSRATLASPALAEIVRLAKRVGSRKVTLMNPSPLLRRTLSVSCMDRFVDVVDAHTYAKSA